LELFQIATPRASMLGPTAQDAALTPDEEFDPAGGPQPRFGRVGDLPFSAHIVGHFGARGLRLRGPSNGNEL
jgi:hypothetical protein